MCYAYIPEVNKKGKLSNKAEKLRFIGYSSQTKGYRLIDESTSKVLVRRDVIFKVAVKRLQAPQQYEAIQSMT